MLGEKQQHIPALSPPVSQPKKVDGKGYSQILLLTHSLFFGDWCQVGHCKGTSYSVSCRARQPSDCSIMGSDCTLSPMTSSNPSVLIKAWLCDNRTEREGGVFSENTKGPWVQVQAPSGSVLFKPKQNPTRVRVRSSYPPDHLIHREGSNCVRTKMMKSR